MWVRRQAVRIQQALRNGKALCFLDGVQYTFYVYEEPTCGLGLCLAAAQGGFQNSLEKLQTASSI